MAKKTKIQRKSIKSRVIQVSDEQDPIAEDLVTTNDLRKSAVPVNNPIEKSETTTNQLESISSVDAVVDNLAASKDVDSEALNENHRGSSWASLLRSNRAKTTEGELRFIAPAVKNGKRIVRFSSTKASHWKNAVVASVYGEIPSFFRFQNFALNRWKDSGLLSVQLLKDNIFLLNFACAESKLKMLSQGPITFNRKPVLLQEWKERLNLSTSTFTNLPIWIQLPLLPLEFWTSEILSRIGSICGKPLFVDQCTLAQSRLGFARLLVEMDILGDFPTEIVLEDDLGIQFTQPVLYEWSPKKCPKCHKPGHVLSECSLKTSQAWKAKLQGGSQEDVGRIEKDDASLIRTTTEVDNPGQEIVTEAKTKALEGTLSSNSTSIGTPQHQPIIGNSFSILQDEEWPSLSGEKGVALQLGGHSIKSTFNHSHGPREKQTNIDSCIRPKQGNTVKDKEHMLDPIKKKTREKEVIKLGVIGEGRKSSRLIRPNKKYG